MIKEESKKVTKADGTVAYVWNGKLHNWKGAALINPDGTKEYYLHGIKTSEDDWKSAIKEQKGLPWFKKPGENARY